MSAISQLWLPIIATAIFIFIASSLIHMVFKWHNADYRKLGNEDEVRAAIRAGAPAAGQYVLPHCVDMKEMQGAVMLQKFTEGPVAVLTVRENGAPKMGAALAMWFVFSLAIAAIAGALAAAAFGMKGNVGQAANLVGAVSFLAYAGGSVPMAIWMGKPWGSVAKDFLDAAIYAVISACVFQWLWP